MQRRRQISPLKFFSKLRWLDGRPLLDTVEPYRRAIFEQMFYTFDENGRPRFNLGLFLRGKKNWKTGDLIFAALYCLLVWKTQLGNECYIFGNDEDQAGDDLDLGKKIIRVNPILTKAVDVKQKVIERKDGEGFLKILPAQDIVGTHGKTYLFAGFDEIHGHRNWDLLEAMQLDPSRPDARMWITSYNSIYHKPGVPLFDLSARGWKGEDPRMLFSYYAADRTTDPVFENALPENRANPSRESWSDPDYLEQQQRRLPAHKYRRLHLNLPGLPEGSAFTAEMVMNAIDRGVKVRPPEDGIDYFGFVDMSSGSNDDACLGIAHKDAEGRAILDHILNQGQRPPFDPQKAVERFANKLKEYRVFSVTGDRFAGNTFQAAFESQGIAYRVSDLTKSKLYEALEPKLNAGQVVLLDHPVLEQQFLGLVWRGGKIDHTSGEHDDFANSVAGVTYLTLADAWGTADDIILGKRGLRSDSDFIGLFGSRGDRNRGPWEPNPFE